MAIDAYDIGDTVRLTATFTNESAANADPTTVTVSIRAPDGTVTTPTATQSSTGVYYCDLAVTMAGVWRYRFAGTGALVAAGEGQLFVRESVFV